LIVQSSLFIATRQWATTSPLCDS